MLLINSFSFVGMIVIGQNGNIAVGTSTNGANHKIQGFV